MFRPIQNIGRCSTTPTVTAATPAMNSHTLARSLNTSAKASPVAVLIVLSTG